MKRATRDRERGSEWGKSPLRGSGKETYEGKRKERWNVGKGGVQWLTVVGELVQQMSFLCNRLAKSKILLGFCRTVWVIFCTSDCRISENMSKKAISSLMHILCGVKLSGFFFCRSYLFLHSACKNSRTNMQENKFGCQSIFFSLRILAGKSKFLCDVEKKMTDWIGRGHSLLGGTRIQKGRQRHPTGGETVKMITWF